MTLRKVRQDGGWCQVASGGRSGWSFDNRSSGMRRIVPKMLPCLELPCRRRLCCDERSYFVMRKHYFNPDFRCDDGTETVQMRRTS